MAIGHLSRGREALLDGWWGARLPTVVSWEDGSNRRLQVVECYLDVSRPPRLLMVCD